ncbi:hypothetical protein B296_00028909 [Ensete ventricosum]|uniref:Uncharacterized protein n=1 Tax=Ensete ventricosum TaxID=4639 RepID=A0A426Z503_ENSVE|nr:hypothetical protein B296_00028909 [Ensete ventricosum]
MFHCPHPPLVQSRGAGPFCSDVRGSTVRAWMAVEGAVGLGMAGRGATLVLRTSWFNYSSWICAKEITAIRVYGCLTNLCQLSIDVIEIGWSEVV